jgi:hypothetical protein
MYIGQQQGNQILTLFVPVMRDEIVVAGQTEVAVTLQVWVQEVYALNYINPCGFPQYFQAKAEEFSLSIDRRFSPTVPICPRIMNISLSHLTPYNNTQLDHLH